MKKYTVIGFYEETGQIFSHYVLAHSSGHAFTLVAEDHSSANFLAAIDGHAVEGRGIEFVGESIVDAETILSQPEVF